MRRKTNRIFRYFFPASIICGGLFLITQEPAKEISQESAEKQSTILETNDKTQAKMLKVVSHNPQTQARLQVNAIEAVQNIDKITLNNPVGTFEKPDGLAYLKSSQASYYEANKEVHFFEKVSFNHHSGLIATTEHAILDTKTQDITGNTGIKACHHENTITANAYEIESAKNIVSFSGNVCLSVQRKKI